MARPIAPRFEITVLKDKSGTDRAQIPAIDATVHFYRQGATVSAPVTIPAFHADVTVSVYDVGRLSTNDTVRVGEGAATLMIGGISSPTEILVANNSASPVVLGVGMRLVPTNNRPQVYGNPQGTVPIGTSLGVDGVTGRASAYLSQDRMDYDVSIPGQAPRLYVDGSGVMGRSDQR